VTEASQNRAGAKVGWAIWLAWVGLALLFVAVSVQKIWAGDFWGQLRTGQWILEHRAWPQADEYTFTRAGTPVTEVRWLYCVAVALGWRVGAWVLCLGQAVLLAAMWAILAWRPRRALTTVSGVLVLGLAIAAGSGRWVLRPELMTDFFLATFLVLLDGAVARRGEGAPSRWSVLVRGMALVIVQVLWVNTHSVYVLGPLVAAVFAGARFVEVGIGRITSKMYGPPAEGSPRWSEAIWLVVISLAVTAACWVNPYGQRGAVYAIEMWREARAGSVTGGMIGELRSPLAMPLAMWTWDIWAIWALVAVVAATFVVNLRRVPIARAIMFAAGVYLAATSLRNAALVAVIGAWAGLRNVAEMREAWATLAPRPWMWDLRSGALVSMTAAAIGFAWYVATDRHAIAIGAPKEFGLGVVEWDTPRGAADFVVSSGARPQVFNSIRDGHYLGWRSEGKIKVFVDGRTDVIGDELLGAFEAVSPHTWDATADRFGINTAIVPVKNYPDLVAYLAHAPAWALVYLDHRNMVFVRDIPDHASLIASYRIDPAKPWTGPLESAEERVEPWKAAIGGPGRPWFSLGMAESFLAIGSFENAARFLEAGVAKFPRHERLRATLAAVDQYLGKRSEAATIAGWLNPRSQIVIGTQLTLAGWLVASGRKAEAARTLEAVLEASPDDAAARVHLADQYFQLGDFARAAEHYHRALGNTTGPAADWKKFAYALDQTKDYISAADAYRISLAADPNQPDTYYLLGRCLARQRDNAGAILAFRQALKLKPDYGAAQQALDTLLGSH
jgi:tetratricopeptide (TPR) repeat protein